MEEESAAMLSQETEAINSKLTRSSELLMSQFQVCVLAATQLLVSPL
jgi:hypothetical protein